MYAAAAAAAVQALVAAGADVSARTYSGAEPLHWAALNTDAVAAAGAVQALVAAGAGVRARDDDGEEPLHWMAFNEDATAAAAAVQALVAAGADVRARADNGREPLHCAAANLNAAAAAAAVPALVAAGADLRACDSNGSPPLLLARERRDAASCHQLLFLLAPGASGTEAASDVAGGSGSGTRGSEGQALKLAAAGFRQLLKRKGPAAAPEPPAAQPADCVVCLDAPRSVALSPCGHLALCGTCAGKEEVSKQCPVCRERAYKTMTIYHP
jgi:hypothetical protein